jgi:hypothetical protein
VLDEQVVLRVDPLGMHRALQMRSRFTRGIFEIIEHAEYVRNWHIFLFA